MPKIQVSSAATSLFNLDGLDYGKNQYQIEYSNIIVKKNGDTDYDKLQVGIKNKYTEETLQGPTSFSNWVNSSDVAYASLEALITDLEAIVGFESGGGGGPNAPSSDHIFETAASRDIYFPTHLSELIFQTPIFVGDITIDPGPPVVKGTEVQIWGQPTIPVPTMYDNTQWINNATIGLTALQVKVLNESNANTNALIDTKLGVLDRVVMHGNAEAIRALGTVFSPITQVTLTLADTPITALNKNVYDNHRLIKPSTATAASTITIAAGAFTSVVGQDPAESYSKMSIVNLSDEDIVITQTGGTIGGDASYTLSGDSSVNIAWTATDAWIIDSNFTESTNLGTLTNPTWVAAHSTNADITYGGFKSTGIIRQRTLSTGVDLTFLNTATTLPIPDEPTWTDWQGREGLTYPTP
jgi:hypothetical protein